MPDTEEGTRAAERLLSIGIGALLVLIVMIALPLVFSSTQPNRAAPSVEATTIN